MKEEIIIFRYLDQELTPNLHKTKFNKIKYFKSNLFILYKSTRTFSEETSKEELTKLVIDCKFV